MPEYRFTVSKNEGKALVLNGAVPSDSARRYFRVIAGNAPVAALSVDPDAPESFMRDAAIGIRSLKLLRSGELDHENGSWLLKGVAEDDEARNAVLGEIASLDSSVNWQTEISLLPPIELCREHVARFAEGNTILFNAGSASLAKTSYEAIDQLADNLEECPNAEIHVEGHTDADGPDDLNLALSVSRAETVVSELISRGVRESRLYAIGYGEGVPVASNETDEGKQRNRRIGFTVVDAQP